MLNLTVRTSNWTSKASGSHSRLWQLRISVSMTERVGPRLARYFGLDVWSGTHQMWPHSSHSKYLASCSIVLVSSRTFRLSQSGQGGTFGEKVGSSGGTVERPVYRKMPLAVCRKPDPTPFYWARMRLFVQDRLKAPNEAS
jgi:hypothetical protein